MLLANEFAFINVTVYIRIVIKALKLTLLPNCRSYSLNFMFWKFHTWSELLASKLQTKTYSKELLSGEVWIMNTHLCLWRGRKLISVVMLFTEHYLGKWLQRNVSWVSSFFLFGLSPEDTGLAGSAAVGRVHWFSANFCMFLAAFSELEIPIQNAVNSCK